jgi:hypothetical protein
LVAISAKFKTSRAIATSNVIQLQLASGVSESDAGSFPGANSVWSTAAVSAGTGAVQTIETSQIIPAGHKWATVFLVSYQAGDGSGYNVLWDDVFVQPVGGSAFIADASILNAKIANLAVDNAKIANVAIGKLTAGSLSADMTVSARIKTADTGARVELNSSGLQAFNSGGAQTVDIASATGNATFTGTFQTDFDSATNPHIKMTNSGDRTTIWFYDNSGLAGSGNFAFMNTPADANDIPRVGINSGAFDYTPSVVEGRHRLFLNNDGGMQLETYRIDNSSLFMGGRLNLGPEWLRLDFRLASGTQTGGSLYMDGNQFQLARNGSGVHNGGSVVGTDTHLWLEVSNTGTTASQVSMDEDGLIQFWKGKFDNFVNLGSEQGIFAGSVPAASGLSWAVSYGTTRASSTFPIVTPKFGVPQQWAVTADSSTSFTVEADNTSAGAIRFWCFRT